MAKQAGKAEPEVWAFDFAPYVPHAQAMDILRAALDDDGLRLVVRYGERAPWGVVTRDEAGRPVYRLFVLPSMVRPVEAVTFDGRLDAIEENMLRALDGDR